MIVDARKCGAVSFSYEAKAVVFGSIFQFYELDGMGSSCRRGHSPHFMPFLHVHCSRENTCRLIACLTNQRKHSAPNFVALQSVSLTNLLSPPVGSA